MSYYCSQLYVLKESRSVDVTVTQDDVEQPYSDRLRRDGHVHPAIRQRHMTTLLSDGSESELVAQYLDELPAVNRSQLGQVTLPQLLWPYP